MKRGKPFPKGNIPWNKKDKIKLICQFCGKEYETYPCWVKRNSKYCSILCGNRGKAKENKELKKLSAEKNGAWKGGISIAYYRKLFKDKLPKKCEICNSKKYLQVHHIDEDRKNNDMKNLQVICTSCHHKIHKKIFNIIKMKNIN